MIWNTGEWSIGTKDKMMFTQRFIKLSAFITTVCLLNISVNANDGILKRKLNNNMTLSTKIVPKSADNFLDMFKDGMFYGRLRMNAFNWNWKAQESVNYKDNYAFGIGGSLIYQTASIQGLSAQVGYYYSGSPFPILRTDSSSIGTDKAGKDTVSRYKVLTSGNYNMSVLGQANLQYKISNTTVIAGRQIFESLLTKSNDTKMVPNTFEGVIIDMQEIPMTRIRVGYFTAQKLRDHTTFHDVVTFGDAYNATTASQWHNNDDGAVHKGLSYKNFIDAGKDVNHELIVADLRNKSIKNLQIDVTYGDVPDVVSSLTGEVNYKIPVGGFILTPGVRYMKQFDNGGGSIGGATLKGKFGLDQGVITNNLGYKDVHSLDSSIWMARLVLKKGSLKVKVGYSAVEDAADIVAPWRGFPTGGYTRAMAQYNWYANTKTTSTEVNFDFDKAGLITGFSAMARYAIQNFDEAKQAAGIQADSKILHMDFRENIIKDFYAKVRVGLVSADARTSGVEQDAYSEYRFELNYLF